METSTKAPFKMASSTEKASSITATATITKDSTEMVCPKVLGSIGGRTGAVIKETLSKAKGVDMVFGRRIAVIQLSVTRGIIAIT